MKIYDISQEVLGSVVFPGDPAPKTKMLSKMSDGALYNLTVLEMCAHNGTHVDAPFHFCANGKTIDMVDINKFVGMAYVKTFDGELDANNAREILEEAKQVDITCEKKILLKGKAVVSFEAAQVFAKEGIDLLGNESQTVGPEDGPMAVHVELLEKEVVLLEGIRLSHVPDGAYLLNAAPINLAGSDGAPCRAILIKI